MRFDALAVRDLVIEDEGSFAHVGIYQALRRALIEDDFRFRVPKDGALLSWSRALFLNLTFWNAAEPNDVLCGPSIEADVLAHAAWHHLARKNLGTSGPPSAEAMFLGESIASAFDLYLVGRLLGHARSSSFLESQVPAMADAALEAGLSDEDFESLLADAARDPERAFEDLRALLFDACVALLACNDVDSAAAALHALDDRRMAPLLHHYEISNWVLFAKTYGTNVGPDARAREIHEALRSAEDAVAWLEAKWLVRAPTIG